MYEHSDRETMKVAEERLDQCITRETNALELESVGEAMITVGEALLGMDFILVCFVDISVRTGSRLFIWWTIVEGLLALLFVAIGVHRKSQAHKGLNPLEPE